jgi:hypothetical protein
MSNSTRARHERATHQLSHEVTSRGRFLCVWESCGASSTKRRPSMRVVRVKETVMGGDTGRRGRIFGNAWGSVFKRLCHIMILIKEDETVDTL